MTVDDRILDQLDRIEGKLDNLGERVAVAENDAEHRTRAIDQTGKRQDALEQDVRKMRSELDQEKGRRKAAMGAGIAAGIPGVGALIKIGLDWWTAGS